VRQFISFLLISAAIALAACQNSTSNKEDDQPGAGEFTGEDNPAGGVSEKTMIHPGKAVYDKYCLACHLADGSGIAGMFPPLTPNPYVNDKNKIIDVVLNGMSGKIEVNGETYNNFMVPHSHLTDEELANVISYVRTSFGNELEPVTKEEINAARKK